MKILFIEFLNNFGSTTGLATHLRYLGETHVNPKDISVIGSGESIISKTCLEYGFNFYQINRPENDDIFTRPVNFFIEYLKTLYKCLTVALRERPNIIHCYHFMWGIYGNPIGFFLNIQVIIHLKDVWCLEPKIFRILTKFNPKTTYIAVSNYVYRLYSDQYKYPQKKITTIYDGIDPEIFKPQTQWTLEKKLRSPLIIQMSRINIERDIEIFIDTAAIITRKYPKVKFIHYGYMKKRFDEKYFQSLKDRVRSLGLSSRSFTFENYLQTPQEISKAYNHALVSLVTARRFAIPNAGLESMFSGTPCLAYNVGGNPEAINPGKNGSLLPANSAILYADEIEKYLNRKLPYEKYVSAAISDCRRKFDSRRIFAKIDMYYASLLGKRSD